MPITVPCYGVHQDEDQVAYLMQGRGGTNAVGLRSKPPFVVRLPSASQHCNHQIPLACPVPSDVHWAYFTKLLKDPLVRAMLPIPRVLNGVFYIRDHEGPFLLDLLVLLSKMSSPIHSVVLPLWTRSLNDFKNMLRETNVQPLVITEAVARDSTEITQLCKLATHDPRTLVVTGSEDLILPPVVRKIETGVHNEDFKKLMELPWESLGATVLKRWMRNEELGPWS